MHTLSKLNEQLDQKHLLKHPFYQAWSAGELNQSYLATYSQQYFQFEDQFTRFLSAIHAQCPTLQGRQALLHNLYDEESGANNHRELWLQFAEGIGAERTDVINATPFKETKALVDTFKQLSQSSYAAGLGALYAYERQIPEVAASKIEGLKKFYHIDDERTLQFFNIHLTADVYHAQTTGTLIDALPAEEKTIAFDAAKTAADAIWNFLSGVTENTMGCDCLVH